ncbi:hypothetical protein ACC755_37520, partial [Rhizobium ruizarguesonis]
MTLLSTWSARWFLVFGIEEIIDWYKPDSKTVFSGPFKLTSIDIDAGKLSFETNENFFGPKPKLARIDI